MIDMKCPFCGKQMYHPIGKPTWSCQNWDCVESEGMIGNHVLWQALIDTKKKLDICVSALKDFSIHPDDSVKKYAKKALEQITALEQKEVK